MLEIRGNSARNDLPIVIRTTSSDEEDTAFCAEPEVADFVTKPVTYPDLEAAFKKIVETRLRIPPRAWKNLA